VESVASIGGGKSGGRPTPQKSEKKLFKINLTGVLAGLDGSKHANTMCF